MRAIVEIFLRLSNKIYKKGSDFLMKLFFFLKRAVTP